MHISVSNFAAIFNKLQACATTSTEHFLGSSRKKFSLLNFFAGIFLGDTFADQIWNIWYKMFKNKYQIWIPLEKSPDLKKNGLNQSSDVGDIADLKSAILSEFLWRRNCCSANLRSQSVQIRISITWEDAKWSFCFQKQVIINILSYIDWVMPILILEQLLEWVPIRDVPSHPTLVGTCFAFISFNIATFGLGYLETCPPTLGYVGTCYFISNQHHGYGSTA